MFSYIDILNLFGPVWVASGAQGTFGEGYKDHWLRRLGGMCFWFVTFVAKTVTAYENKGNTELKADGFTPLEFIPQTIYIPFRLWCQNVCLNCFGLSNAGIRAALRDRRWQKRKKPFMLSFMPVGKKNNWLDQALYFVSNLQRELVYFSCPTVGLQFNASCPNVGKNPLELAPFMKEILDILGDLRMPIFVKINAQFPIPLAKEISEHPACAGLIMGNTLPFGAKLPDGWPQVDWVKYFGTDDPKKSPLAWRFGEREGETGLICRADPSKAGGLSGAPLLPIVCHWIREARIAGIKCHINAGGGILSPRGAFRAWLAGADSISLGMISGFRPWAMLPTTIFAHVLFGGIGRRVK